MSRRHLAISKKHLPPLRQFAADELYCPITRELFHDPVVAADGVVYERSAIQRWFCSHNTSPSTGLRIPLQLHECVIVRRMVEAMSKARLVPAQDVRLLQSKGTPRPPPVKRFLPVADLIHAYQCTSSACTRPSCAEMKTMLQRIRAHRTIHGDTSGTCKICRLINALDRNETLRARNEALRENAASA